MNELRDFTHAKNFPGTTGNSFDLILHRYARIEHVPWPLFGLGMAFFAWLVTGFRLERAAILYAYILVDWLLLALLPVANRSFGPPKPPLTILAIARAPFLWLPLEWALAAQIIGTLLVVYGFWIEPHALGITRQRLVSDKLKPGTSLKVLHLGDLHVERITGRERQLIEAVTALKPDLILFSGDVLNLSYLHDSAAHHAARQILAKWQAPLGAYAVTGSPAVDLEDEIDALYHGLPVRLLRNERISIPVGIDQLDLVGINCSHKPFLDAPILESLLPTLPSGFTLLLYHSPDLAPNAARLGVDLHLAGHTHGGQVRLPIFGPLFTGSLYGRRFGSGRYILEKMILYITRGIGLEGAGAPRVRFLCPPEIIVWEICGPDSNHAR